MIIFIIRICVIIWNSPNNRIVIMGFFFYEQILLVVCVLGIQITISSFFAEFPFIFGYCNYSILIVTFGFVVIII